MIEEGQEEEDKEDKVKEEGQEEEDKEDKVKEEGQEEEEKKNKKKSEKRRWCERDEEHQLQYTCYTVTVEDLNIPNDALFIQLTH